MNKKLFKTLCVLCFVCILSCLSITNVSAKNIFDWFNKNTAKKQFVKNEQAAPKAIKCYNCPNNCLIKTNETGKCGKYKNIDGKLVPVN